jgi:Domain of Unknown Function with PDB structure (DUF3857)
MPGRRRSAIQGLIGALALCAVSKAARAEDWLPISPDELKMTGEPKASGAPAILLYRQVDRDDNGPSEAVYARIKILTEEGRKYADVEVPFDKARESVHGIQARTIHPDGSIAKFDGTVYEKPIVQARGVKWLAKTFTMPDVQVGSIIEYRYRHELQSGFVFDSHWILSQDLFTKDAKFSLDPYRGFDLRYSWPVGLPTGTDAPKEERGKIRLESRDVPAFVTEEYMPPENETKFRVDFIYVSQFDPIPEKDPDVFWKKYGKRMYRVVDDFVDKRRAMTEAAAQIVDPGDSPEVKLHKIYERTLRIRNLSFERQKSQQEAERENPKTAKNVEDLWKQGYGNGNQIAWLFLALVRAAGIQADPVIVATRDVRFFNYRTQNPAELNSNVVLVTLNGKEIFLDPGTALVPFGLLPWSETAVKGLRLDKDGGTWIETPLTETAESRVERKGNLKLATNGTLEGKMIVTFTGQEALWRRQEERNEDDAARKQFLEDEIKADIPSGIVVELVNRPEWTNASPTLVTEYDLKIPGWASIAGQRAVMPVGLFGGQDKRTFQHQTRTHPIYFGYRHQSADDVTIELPVNWQVQSSPQPVRQNDKVLDYASSSEIKNGSLHLNRELTVATLFIQAKFYGAMQNFFEVVRTGDEAQIILTPVKKMAAQ